MGKIRLVTAVGAVALLMIGFQNCSQVGFNEKAIELPSFCVDISKPEVRPTLLWDWKAELANSPAPHYETFDQVMSAPMVADLDGDGPTEVVFTTFSTVATDIYADSVSPTPHAANGVLRVVDGPTGRTKFSVAGPVLSPFAAQSPLLMDIDGDGRVEIFYVQYKRDQVIALNYDGTVRWSLALPLRVSMNQTGLTGAKLDQVGAAEIHFGPYIISEDASKAPYIQATLINSTPAHTTSLALPLDPSNPSKWSIVTSQGIYNPDGTRVGAAFPNTMKWLAAADLAPEVPGLEIVSVGSASLNIVNGITGASLKSIDLTVYNELVCPKGVGGGPPSVGDFDGDPSTLEIAVATGRHLAIFDRNGALKYKTDTQDCSSLATGLTSFDMNGDGKPEVLYADEEYLRIFEIRAGKLEVMHKVINPSGTLYEYPVVADLFGTGRSSNMLLAANNYAAYKYYKDAEEVDDAAVGALITGVRAFRSTGDRSWAPTKPIWNQYSFHPDLTNSKAQFDSKPDLDTSLFRRNTQGQLEQFVKPCGKTGKSP